MKRLVIGILAHVDAGKTTLSEGLLFTSGKIKKMGRVDNGDAFLDTYGIEKERGITIFSKQAELEYGDTHISLLDTPGHVDFSAEMERTLQVLDYAILVISGSDGVQGHTRTLWHLLNKYRIPVFIFINKMDQIGTERDRILYDVRNGLSESCIDFSNLFIEKINNYELYDSIAMNDENAMNDFIGDGILGDRCIQRLIVERKVFPCFFGSALKGIGIDTLLMAIDRFAMMKNYGDEFGARVFKIAHDEQDCRLTYLKITGGSLCVKDMITTDKWSEKINQIRVYSGLKYRTEGELYAGSICAVTGLTMTNSGDGLGCDINNKQPILIPVLNYRMIIPDTVNKNDALRRLRMLEEEEPELSIEWNEELQEIHVKLMGEVQIEVLKKTIANRFNMNVEFSSGSIVYKETIADTVEGVGHFEPLRHYAEVHLLMEPGLPGTGIRFSSNCSEDILSKNWQRLILTNLAEKDHKGVLTGSVITDIIISIVNGRAHQKHTEGGDFRQAVYRAVRNGLMQAQSVLLEPYYEFRLELPSEYIGRAMSDFEKMNAIFELKQANDDVSISIIEGAAPVICMNNYQAEINSYTKGLGRILTTFAGYMPCHNTDEVIDSIGYDAERDINNTADSVFCEHGSGFVVRWDEVAKYMHLENITERDELKHEDNNVVSLNSDIVNTEDEEWLGTDEIDRIIYKTFYANSRDDVNRRKGATVRKMSKKDNDYSGIRESFGNTAKRKKTGEKYLLVDGYNVIFAWEELSDIAKDNIDGARGRLLDIMCNYQAIVRCNLIVVFDAYRVQGHDTTISDYHNIHVVFTKEAETADQYIEKFAHENNKKYNITVATSDGLEQIIIRGEGCELISSRELLEDVKRNENRIRESYIDNKINDRNYIKEYLPKNLNEDIDGGES